MELNKTEQSLAKKIGRNISKYRRDLKLTSEKLAYENGVSKGYLSKIENGQQLPSLKFLLHISKALKVSVKNLVE